MNNLKKFRLMKGGKIQGIQQPDKYVEIIQKKRELNSNGHYEWNQPTKNQEFDENQNFIGNSSL